MAAAMRLSLGMLALVSILLVEAHAFRVQRQLDPSDLYQHAVDLGSNNDGSLCGSHRFTCHGIKKCVSLSKKCDGADDCGDNSDEADCPEAASVGLGEPLCGTSRFTCQSVMKCVAFSKKCDGKDDCGDNSDENDCTVIG